MNKEVGLLVAILLKDGVKSLQKMLIQFSLLAKKAVLLAYKRQHSVINRFIIIQNFVSDAISAMYKRMSATSQHIDVLTYLPILRSLLLKLITFQLFKQNKSLSQATDTTTSINSRQYTGGFTFFSHRIQLSISKAIHCQTTGDLPTSEQQEKHATTAPAEEAYISMHSHTINNSNENDNNTTSPGKATTTTLPPLPKSPGLNALAKYSKMDNTPRSRTKDATADDDSVQHRNKGGTIPAVLFP